MTKSSFYSGVMESAGLGEVAYFLKAVKKNLAYACFALDNTSFTEISTKAKGLEKKIVSLKNMLQELDLEIENLGQALAEEIEDAKEAEDNKENQESEEEGD